MNSDGFTKAAQLRIGCFFLVLAFFIAVCGGLYVGIPWLFMRERHPWMLLWITVPFGISLGFALLAYWLMKSNRGDDT